MRFVTLNTWGRRGNWPARLQVFRGRLPAARRGHRHVAGDDLTDDAGQGAEMLAPDYHLAQQQTGEEDRHGITTAQQMAIRARLRPARHRPHP
jgi:hypothetical protein